MHRHAKLQLQIAKTLYYMHNEQPFEDSFLMFRFTFWINAGAVIDLLIDRGILE